jgi:hypothetical protein
MPWGKARKLLRERGWSKSEIEQAKQDHERIAKEGRQNAANARHLKKNWRDLLHPLRVERRIVRSQLLYWTKDRSKPHHVFYRRYGAILDQVYALIVAKLSERQEIAASVGASLNLPSNGAHWVDWVDWAGLHLHCAGTEWDDKFKPIEGLRQAVLDDYAGLTFKAGRRRKRVLSRVTQQAEREQKSLYKRTANELATLQREQVIDPNDERAATIKKMQRALRLIDNLDLEEPVPFTWHGVMKDETTKLG